MTGLSNWLPISCAGRCPVIVTAGSSPAALAAKASDGSFSAHQQAAEAAGVTELSLVLIHVAKSASEMAPLPGRSTS
jgi:alkanesulfonate monooxygenase SsuD/methylene tetrahydromethanopterin reductase-like flavin-dependent oxidoreductase (luciferase family)